MKIEPKMLIGEEALYREMKLNYSEYFRGGMGAEDIDPEDQMDPDEVEDEIEDIKDEYAERKELRVEAFDTFMKIEPKMLIGEECFLPCTPHGIIKLIEFSGMDIKGKHAVVIGRSNIVGKPVAVLLSRKETNATVTLCHTGTPDIAAFTRQADIVVVAAGRPNTLTGDMLKEGAVVIDVGVNRIADASRPKGFRLAGDADYESCSRVASAITPVPGGVGPMTITMLLWNTLESAKRAAR
jgi:5,10-methylene-tetrahydrofolate dehydrogenase/methenyl tetrahydrofolate cyclohydrolase